MYQLIFTQEKIAIVDEIYDGKNDDFKRPTAEAVLRITDVHSLNLLRTMNKGCAVPFIRDNKEYFSFNLAAFVYRLIDSRIQRLYCYDSQRAKFAIEERIGSDLEAFDFEELGFITRIEGEGSLNYRWSPKATDSETMRAAMRVYRRLV